jgi:hypothetical protein
MGAATWSGGNFQLGASTVADTNIASNAAIDVVKLKHAYYARSTFGLKITDLPVAHESIVHVANQAGVLRSFAALMYTHLTGGSVTIDLKKNGVSVLTAPITLDNTLTDRQIVTASFSSTPFVAGDVFTIAETISSPAGGAGPTAWVSLAENGAP